MIGRIKFLLLLLALLTDEAQTISVVAFAVRQKRNHIDLEIASPDSEHKSPANYEGTEKKAQNQVVFWLQVASVDWPRRVAIELARWIEHLHPEEQIVNGTNQVKACIESRIEPNHWLILGLFLANIRSVGKRDFLIMWADFYF